jgi:hypothetical protein
MKKFIFFFLILTSSVFLNAEEEQEVLQNNDPIQIPIEEAQRIQKEGASLRLQLNDQNVYGPKNEDEETDSNSWKDEQRFRLYQECAHRRALDLSFSNGNFFDRNVGNRIRQNFEENRRNSVDGFESYIKSDNTVGRVRKDPCEGLNPKDSKTETDERGCVYKFFRGKKSLIQGSCKW